MPAPKKKRATSREEGEGRRPTVSALLSAQGGKGSWQNARSAPSVHQVVAGVALPAHRGDLEVYSLSPSSTLAARCSLPMM